MRFMMLMIPAVYQGVAGRKAGADFTPSAGDVENMMKFNEELAKSGALISLDGLRPPTQGARVSFGGGKVHVSEGAAMESKNVLGGYWMISVKSKEEALNWAKRVPAANGDVVEVRQVFEMDDFPPEVQKAGESPVVEAQLAKQKGA